MAEEFWPISRHNVDGIFWRFLYNGDEFAAASESWARGDEYYLKKVTSIFEGRFRSEEQMRSSLRKISRGLIMLNSALRDQDKRGVKCLVGDELSLGDVAIYPRLVKGPQNGLLVSNQSHLFPSILSHFSHLSSLYPFYSFWFEDGMIWRSGRFPLFLGWIGCFFSWDWMVRIGNWRNKKEKVERYTLDKCDWLLEEVGECGDKRGFNWDNEDCRRLLGEHGIEGDGSFLFINPSNPISLATVECLRIMEVGGLSIIDVVRENLMDLIEELSPLGELPILVDTSSSSSLHIVRGGDVMVEYLSEIHKKEDLFGDVLTPLERAMTRRWVGWVKTAVNYQVKSLVEKEGKVEDNHPSLIELENRVDYLEDELKNSEFVGGRRHKTYGDIFVKCLVEFCCERGFVEMKERIHVKRWLNKLETKE